MNLEDRLRDEAAAEHPNPLAGRGPALVAASRRRRQQRQSSALGVGAAALVALALVVPGPWRAGPVVGDPTTAPVTDTPEQVDPVSVCELTILDLNRGDPSDVEATLAVTGNEVTVTLTSTTDEVREVRETGNEVWLVDAGTGRVVAYQADLTVPLGMPLVQGEPGLVVEVLDLTPCPQGVVTDGGYQLYVRGSVVGSGAWLAGPLDVVLDEEWLAPAATEPAAGAVRPELCEVPWANVNPALRPGPPGDFSDVEVTAAGVMTSDGVPHARVMLGNTSEDQRTVWSDGAEFFLVDRVSLATVGYAAVDAEPSAVVLEPGVPTELWQSFDPRSCDGDPLPDGWYLLFARGAVVESDPWLAHPTLIGWVDGEPGAPPSDATGQPDGAVPLDPFADPWSAPEVGGLTIAGSMPTTPLSGRWDGADSIQQVVPVTNAGSERFQARVWSWVILVSTSGAEPRSIAVEPHWTLPLDLDLEPGETVNIPAVHWLGRAAAFEHQRWDDPATWPGTYDAYIALVDVPSYDPVSGTGFTYAVAGPYPITIE